MNKMKELRENNGYTQQQFADLLDVTINTVQKWEQGATKPGRRSQKDLRHAFPEIEDIDSLFSAEEV